MSSVLAELPLYLQGLGATLYLLGATVLFALPLGILVAALRISPIGSLRAVAATYTELLRNTPLTLVFFFEAFVLPRLGVTLDFEVGAIVALTLYTTPFFAEAIRSGINSVPVGQAEAARAIGLTFTQSVTLVILPQALRSVVPPLINVIIALTKNTSVASGFFVFTLVSVGQRLANVHPADVALILLFVGVGYLIITVPLGQLADRLEKRVAVSR
ncbi:amino acid ABC transporter permease [Compostimonas suwonensis]|uniref:Glutamate transport system permease protein n=1 Tax=Compostimonas suwonensis TaxID=1048394 RepID=A0A2M9BTP2_9MICO|nr:amino acid ABC transporter permease [Compostimonas suwonensis]PJJ61315.1 glutamate transport system permease protein [Compostimonas suwonensis]